MVASSSINPRELGAVLFHQDCDGLENCFSPRLFGFIETGLSVDVRRPELLNYWRP